MDGRRLPCNPLPTPRDDDGKAADEESHRRHEKPASTASRRVEEQAGQGQDNRGHSGVRAVPKQALQAHLQVPPSHSISWTRQGEAERAGERDGECEH